jgi:hypothetical protein
MNTDPPAEIGYFADYLNQPEVRKALNVGAHTMQSGHDCEMHLLSDFMASLKSVSTCAYWHCYSCILYCSHIHVLYYGHMGRGTASSLVLA